MEVAPPRSSSSPVLLPHPLPLPDEGDSPCRGSGRPLPLNIPAKSAPSSGFSSPVQSPRRLSSVDFLSTATSIQGANLSSAQSVWSPDLYGSSPRCASPEKIMGSQERSPRTSPLRSPVLRSKNPSAPPSPMHPKLFPENHVSRPEGNGSVNFHPLPLPPASVSPKQTNFSHQPVPKVDAPSMAGQWQKGKLIGSGTFGCVYEAANRHTGALCAMKEVNIIPDDAKSAESLKQLEQEIKFLSQFKHENIVQYYGSEYIEDRFYIYLEYVHPGSINKYVNQHCGAMTESVIRSFTRHILKGLAFLHSQKIMHRDIKGANLLVDVNGVVKLADFGMAKHLSTAAPNLSLKGTPYWMAPEVVQATLVKDAGYDLAVDIWSLGCTIIEMFTGKPPWSGLEGPAAMFKVLHKDPSIPDSLSLEGKEFLRCCFRRNPAERPTASKLLEHPFVHNSNNFNQHSALHSSIGLKSTLIPYADEFEVQSWLCGPYT
uniref:mitogen-activated protein kinase kinase kinase n=1 Tax=Oryza meridionalis TaxID=40149 RepID=A0A0E0D7A0_9ORYZ